MGVLGAAFPSGPLAQMEEPPAHNRSVAGSSPAWPIWIASAFVIITGQCYGECRGAQAHLPEVRGSSPYYPFIY